MDQTDIDRCSSFAFLTLGRALKSADLDSLVTDSSSFAEFRVKMILSDSFRPTFASVVDHWRTAVPHKGGVPSRSLSALGYAIEKILSRLDSIDSRVEKQEVQLLDAAKSLDAIATTHQNTLKDTTELRAITHSLRTRLSAVASRSDEKKSS